jgi:hypothetical protein
LLSKKESEIIDTVKKEVYARENQRYGRIIITLKIS